MQGADFSHVRVHRDAASVTSPLRARAVTRGQDIYFHPGEYRPDTPAGEALIAHELAHTRQTRESAETSDRAAAFVSRPGDALETNAHALARGLTAHVFAAPAGAALRGPFDNESATDRDRRERLIQSISNAQETILRLLRTGGLVADAETAVERGGVRGVVYGEPGSAHEIFSSYADRDARLRRIVRSLIVMARYYRTTPIPADFTAPVAIQVESEGPAGTTTQEHYESTFTHPQGTLSFTGLSPEWTDLQSAYERYLRSQGRGSAMDFNPDWMYLDPDSVIVPGAARGARRISRGVPSGAYMVFPDVDREPLRYWRLDGYTPAPKGSIIIEFWHDDFGYYYEHKGQRIDVESPWSTPRSR